MPVEKLGSFGMLKREEEEEDGQEEQNDGVLFYVNTEGFPVTDRIWDRMWNHVAKIHPDGYSIARKIRNAKDLPEITPPQVPCFSTNTPIFDRLELIQKYMSDFQYNHTGTQFFSIRKNRPISGLMESAKEMIREALPIKCLEAVILGLYLTREYTSIDRFTISFKSCFQGNTHRHVVLGLHYAGKYGALGMSRRTDLMYKPLLYKSLSQLVLEYKRAYEKYMHELKKVKIGWPVSHDCHSYEQINWKSLSLTVKKSNFDEISKDMDRHAREMKSQITKFEKTVQAYSGYRKLSKTAAMEPTGSPKHHVPTSMSFKHDKHPSPIKARNQKKSKASDGIVLSSHDTGQYEVRI